MTLLQRSTAVSEPRHRAERPPGRRRSRWLAASTTVALATSLLGLTAPAANAAPNTTITLTFDDANADQIAAAAKINGLGMPGTFFTPSGFIGATGYMTAADVVALQAAGNEIAGHTVTHPDLAQMGTDEVKRQVCNDRVNLTNMGLNVTNFAYPFASLTPEVQTIVQGCGYNSARGLGDLESKVAGTAGFGFAEAIPVPAADLYDTKAPDEVDNTWTLLDMQNLVTKAVANGGGWVQLTFHHVGAGTDPTTGTADPLTVSTDLFNQFADWLAQQKAAGTIDVKNVRDVIGGASQPVVAGPAAPVAVTTGNLVKNPSLETDGPAATGLPKCWAQGGFGTNTRTFTKVAPGHAGTATAAQQLVMSAYTSGDGKLLPTLDLGECAPSAIAGHTYQMKAWYKSTAPTQFELYYRTGLGTWTYWTASPLVNAATAWTQTTFTTPAVPVGASAISFGLNLISTGTLVTDDYELYDTVSVKTFSDVAATNQFYNEISWLSNNLITQGYPDGTFKPLTSINRDAMAAFLYRLAGSPAVPANAPTFTDVAPSNQFYNEIRWLAAQGISTGYPDGTFRPLAPVNRDAMAAFLYRYNGKPAVPSTAPTFPDVSTGNQFYNEIRWLAATTITTGYPDGTFRPVQAITRDAMAAFIYRYNLNFPKGM